MNNSKIIENLNDLLTKNYDAEAGYNLAAENVENTALKSFLEARAKDRYDFGHALKDEITSLGGTPDKGTSIKGDVHRVWMNLKDAFSTGDEATYKECVRGEKAFVKEYQEVLENRENLSPNAINLVEKQLSNAQIALAEVEALEDFSD